MARLAAMCCHRPRVVLILGALVCALVLGLPAFASAVTPVPQGFVGVDVDGPLFPNTPDGVDLGSQFDTMVANGVQSIRVVFDWSSAQPYRTFKQVPSGQTSDFVNVGGIPTRFSQLDNLVGLAAQRGLSILPTVMYAPSWDSTSHPAGSFGTPKHNAAFANFLTALIKRYGPKGTFWATHSPKLPIRAWQIWNEPNINVYWPDQPFQPAYAKLLHAAHDAIKRADPGATVVLAGMPNFSWTQLSRLYKVKNVGKWFDVVALHPYTKDPQGVITIIQKVRTVMNANGDKRKPIVADEISWPSSQGKTIHNTGFDFVTNEAGQASRIGKLLPLLVKNRIKLGLSGFDYYTWAGIEDKNGLAFDFSGLERFTNGAFTAKPALGVFRRGVLKMEGCRSKGVLATVCLH
jgi:hypothetical protein